MVLGKGFLFGRYCSVYWLCYDGDGGTCDIEG